MSQPDRLRRELNTFGAIVVGLGSILGTGAFVAIGLASANWGDAILLAIPLAGIVAIINGLSSASLAGMFPVAGGTYEYAYRTIGPGAGFTAGWLFLLAKTASAATAALGIALYLGFGDARLVAAATVAVVTALVATGLRRTTLVNTVLVTVTVAGLVAFAFGDVGGPAAQPITWSRTADQSVLAAVAFLFVAYTGYGRVATLGEEVRTPERTIPTAVVISLVAAVLLYLGVAFGGRTGGGERWGVIVRDGGTPADLLVEPLSTLVAIAAMTAMFGVLINLILGLSRVLLAMARRRDMPHHLSRLDHNANPTRAIVLSGMGVGIVSLLGDIGLAWSFSAMTVLLYYGITNLAALRLDTRRYSAWAGLASCLFLSFFVPAQIWLLGAGLIGLGSIWKTGIAPRL